MIYHRECKLCGLKLRINGELSMRIAINEHIKQLHPKEYAILQELRFLISRAKDNATNYERELGF
jgi:hypothetical protein